MNILNFILSNWDSILIVIIVIALIIFLITKKQYVILNKIIIVLITEAEKKYGGGTGAIKLAAVIDWVYPKIPAIIQMFITSAKLEKIIEKLLVDAKQKWEKNPNLSVYVGHTTTVDLNSHIN